MSPLAYIMRGAILTYRYTFSAFLGSSCRFRPTCSEYALDAIRLHGAARGGWLAAKRLCRCHPWGSSGFDPAPQPSQRPDSIKSALDDTPRADSCCAPNHTGNRQSTQGPSPKAQRDSTPGHTPGNSPGNSAV